MYYSQLLDQWWQHHECQLGKEDLCAVSSSPEAIGAHVPGSNHDAGETIVGATESGGYWVPSDTVNKQNG